VRSGWEQRLPLAGSSLESAFRTHPDAVRYSGRGAVWSVPAGDGDRAVLRHYRHGGLLAPLTGDVFFGRTPRPVRELEVSEALRERGGRTPEILALFWKRAGPGLYRADLITREVSGASDLASWLAQPRPAAERRRILAEVGRTLASLHAAGLHHPDLNLKNLLISKGEVWVLDLDRAWLGEPLAERDAVVQLKRLERSFRKLSRTRRLASEREALSVLRAYHGRRWRRAFATHWSRS